MGTQSWNVWVGHKCNHACSYKKEAEGDLIGDTERRQWEDNEERFEDLACTFGVM